MLLFGLVVLNVLIILKYLPVRRVVLMEGIFDRSEEGSDFYQPLICFWFENYCRSCFEKNLTTKSSMYGQCYMTVPKKSFRIGNLEPKTGDSVKIWAWKTIFGRVMLYGFTETNFAEEFGSKQIQREKEERKAYDEAVDYRHAIERGMTVEEYRKAEEKESVDYVAEVLDMTPEQVVEFEYHKIPRFNLDILHDLRSELGREPTQDELSTAFQKDFEETRKSVLNTKLVPETPADKAREEEFFEDFQKRQRANEAKQRKLLNTPPGPECLTKEDLHHIHSTGQIPSNRVEHTKTCESCELKVNANRSDWLDRVAPYPRMPRLRLPSIRKKYEIVHD